MSRPLTVAVTGLNATDNPGPGVGVIRSIRAAPAFQGRIVGLAYDVLEPGLYAPGLVDEAWLLPYPSQGLEALEARLRALHEKTPLDVLLPTLDAELPSFIALAPVLESLGIRTFLPTTEQLDLRSKVNLARLGAGAGLEVPRTQVVTDAEDLYGLHRELPYPVWVKGLFYGAILAHGLDDLLAAFHRTVAQWGLPVIVQAGVVGEEVNVVAVGDGAGGLVGAVPMRKTSITDKGKGWSGVTIRDPVLLDLTRRFVAATRWRGPCEVEVIKSKDGTYHLLEVNPRLPAWSHLATGAGLNLAWAVVRLALGEKVEASEDYRSGTMFVRIALDQITDLSEYEALATAGHLVRNQDPRP